MSRSQVMSWAMSTVVHTSMLVVLGSALTAIPVVAPEVPGNRIVVMSSVDDVAAAESVHRESEPTASIQMLEVQDDVQPPHDDPPQSPVVEESTQSPSLSSQPLQLAVSMVSVPSLLPHRQPRKNPFSESVSARSVSHRERQRVASSINHVELPPTSRTHPDSLQPSLVRLAELLPERSPAPADIQPSNASTARQQSSSSVAQTVGTTPIKPARPISNPNPMYPPDAVRQGLEGRVILSVTISFTGKVTRVTVAASCGHQLLDQAALGAVRRWRFSPATRDGKPVEWTARLPIRFRL